MLTRWPTLALVLAALLGAGCNCQSPSGFQVTLTIVGEGQVQVDGARVCGSSDPQPCSVRVSSGARRLAAVPAAGSRFVSWSCSGSPSADAGLDLQVSADLACTVTFEAIEVIVRSEQTLTVTASDGRGGTGGLVTAALPDGGIRCGTGGATCSARVETGTLVTLAAAPDPFFTFTAWSGDCAGTSATADVRLDADRACGARFTHLQVALSLGVVGSGTLTAAAPDGGTLASCALASCPAVPVDTPLVVALAAAPAPNFRVGSWAGDCLAGAGAVASTVTMDGPRTCTVSFVPVDRALTVTRGGSGGGAVAVDPPGTPSGGSTLYPHGTVVHLTAAPDLVSDFTGWEGDCSGTAATATVTLDADRRCNAVFTLKPRTLRVTVSAHGSITSTPAGIDSLAGRLTAAFPHGTGVALAAAPEAHYEAVFGGDCSPAGAVTMLADRSCTVTFRLVKQTLTVLTVGSGSVVSAPAGIDTRLGTGAAPFDYGTAVTLTATPNTGGTQISFVGWSGDCAGSARTVVVTLDANRSCTATFTVTPYDLTVAVAPVAGGSISGTVAGTTTPVITCGGGGTDCSELQLPSDRTVNLLATPAAGWRFDRWSGCATDTTAALAVPMTNTKNCAANFVKQWTVTVSTLTGPGTVSLDRSSTGPGSDRTCTAGGCSQLVDATETVSVTALPANADTVVEAFSCSAGTLAGAVVTIVNPAADVTCTVTFRQRYPVTVAVVGAGGTVASAPAGIAGCSAGGGSCSALFASASAVVLTATPGPEVQVAWSASAGGTCDGTPGSGTGLVRTMSFASLDGAKACTATFSAIPATVNGKAGANGSVSPASSAVTSGGPGVVLTATPALNYQVASWSGAFTAGSGTATGCAGSGAAVTVALSGATPGAVYDCTATFSQLQVTVNGRASGSGTVSPPSATISSGGPGVVLTATPGPSSHLTGWSGAFSAGSGTPSGCSGLGSTATVSVSGAAPGTVYDCTATFAVNTVTLTGASGGNGAVAPASTVVPVGAPATTLTATPAASFHLAGWSGAFSTGSGTATGCAGSGTSVAVAITAATDGAVYVCTASFAVNTVTVAGASGGNGTVAPASTVVPVGAPATTLTATPAASAHLTGWSGAFTSGSGSATGCAGTGPSVAVAISAATDGAVYTCTASFAVNAVTIAGASSGSGTVAPASTATTVGAPATTLTATPGASAHLTGWSGAFSSGSGTATGCSGATASVALAITAATDGAVYTCTATFAVNGVTIAGASSGSGTVAPASTATTVGAPATTLTATPGASAHLTGWSGAFTTGSGTATGCTGATASVAVAITAGTQGAVYTCTATFAVNAVTVAGASSGTGTVAPASTATTVGAPATTLTATPTGSNHLTGWSGAFTTGSGTATGCTGATASVAVAITAATDGAVYTCTAAFAVNAVTLAGASSGTGTVAPASTATTVGAPAITLTATPTGSNHLTGWSGAFTTGSGTATGCTGATASVAVAITAATDGAVYTCTATFAANTLTLTGASGGNGTVAPASTATTVGAPAITLTATPTGSNHLTGWSGAFTTGSGTATGCTGATASVAVAITAATDGAVYTCTATFAANTLTLTGASGGNGTVAPASSTATVGGPGLTLTATPGTGYRVLGWSGAFTSGTGTASGCAGTAGAVTVSFSAGTQGAVYTCTATFQQQSTVTIRVVPGATAATTFGLVSSPCTVAAGASSCTATVDTGTVVTLTTVEAKTARGQNTSRFVKWACSSGTSSTARTATLVVAAATTCVAQYYGLWSRYDTVSGANADASPNVAPLAPGLSGGLPSTSSTFLVDGMDYSAASAFSLAGLVAADDEVGGPKLTDLARPQLSGVVTRLATSGADTPRMVGFDYPAAGRPRAITGSYAVGRSSAGLVSSLARGAFTELYYPDPGPVGALNYTYDGAFLSARQRAAGSALGGFRTFSVTYNFGTGSITQYLNSAWVVLTNPAGAVTASALFGVPSVEDGVSCATPYVTGLSDLEWDPDPANPGGVVVVGAYTDLTACTVGVPCPDPANAAQHTYGYIAKLGPTLNLLAMRVLNNPVGAAGVKLSPVAVADNLAHTGYALFAEYNDVYAGFIQLSYNLATVSTRVGVAPLDVTGAPSPSNLTDALVDRVGNRYLLLATTTFGNSSDVTVISLDASGAPLATDGWRLGTPTFSETAYRIVPGPEGGFFLTGHGPLDTSGNAHFWTARTDERLNVPFNGSAPGFQVTSPLSYAPLATIPFGGTTFPCPAAYVDTTLPTVATVTTAPAPFSPVVNLQAP